MPDLDSDLTRARDRLFDEIEQPPLGDVQRRAGALRRRRTALRSGAVALAVAAVAVVVVPVLDDDRAVPVPPPVAAPSAPVYRDAGITINGLTAPPLQLPGELVEAAFVDELNGYVVARCPDDSCVTFARTSDGGATWAEEPVPADLGPAGPNLVGFPGGGLVLTSGDQVFRYAGGWARLPAGGAGPVASIGPDQILRRDDDGTLSVWSAAQGRIGVLATPPALDPLWVAPAPSTDGAWWVGGALGGVPAVAVSRDAGATWTVRPLTPVGGPVGSVRISTLGTAVYAVVTGPGADLLGIEHSDDAGTTFTRTHAGGDADPATVAGDLVPLPDGRLLAVAPGAGPGQAGTWWISPDDGRSFVQAEDLPAVGRIDRTVLGYVAGGLFTSYAAFTRDGATWRKLEVW